MKKLLLSALVAGMLSLALASAAGAAVVAGNTGWFWSNPLPQGNTLTEIETTAGRAYAAGTAGALMRSDDGGATWQGIRSGLPSALSDVKTLRTITPDSIVFASGCGLRRSDDGGATVRRLPWTSNDVNCPSTISSLSFPSGNVGYLLLGSGEVMQTQDGGDSWRRMTAAPGSPFNDSSIPSDIWFSSPTKGVISIGGQIFYSSDSGSSWTPVQGVDGGGRAHFEFLSATTGYAVGNGTSLYKTTDSGEHWAVVPSDGKINTISVASLSCADENNCLATAATGAAIMRTVDGGANWTALTASSRPIYAVGYTSATHAVAVGADGASVMTNDGGVNWSSLNSEVIGQFNQAHVDSASSAVLFGADTDIARTTNSGASWQSITTFANGSIRDATFPTATRGFVLDTRNALTRTDNGGVNWKVLDLGGASPASIFAVNADTLLLIGDRGVRRSTNAGLSFKKVGGSKFSKLKLFGADAADGSVVAYGAKAIVLSKDGGKSWKKVSLTKRLRGLQRVDFADNKNGWAVDGRGELWATTKGGGKWSRIETTGLRRITSMARVDRQHGYVADGSGSVLVTSDGGKTWAEQAPFLSANKVPTLVAALSTKGALLLVPGSNRILTTASFGQIGAPSTLTIKSSSKHPKKGKTFRISGRLSGAQGGEQITVLARVLDAKRNPKWVSQTATISLGGTFTTSWSISKPTIFVARWAGDATHDGDGANAIVLAPKKKR